MVGICILPNGTDDSIIEVFCQPIYKNIYKKSARGIGLVIYVNRTICDSNSVTTLKLGDPLNPNIIDFTP